MFGCAAYAHVPDSKQTKLDKMAEKLRFVGYSIQAKGYRLFDEKSFKIFVWRDVTFIVLDFTSRSDSAGQLNPTEVDSVKNRKQDLLTWSLKEKNLSILYEKGMLQHDLVLMSLLT